MKWSGFHLGFSQCCPATNYLCYNLTSGWPVVVGKCASKLTLFCLLALLHHMSHTCISTTSQEPRNNFCLYIAQALLLLVCLKNISICMRLSPVTSLRLCSWVYSCGEESFYSLYGRKALTESSCFGLIQQQTCLGMPSLLGECSIAMICLCLVIFTLIRQMHICPPISRIAAGAKPFFF